jgi:hypothetical protein
MNTFGSQVLSFYKQLPQAPQTPAEVTVLYPHRNPKAWDTMEKFYKKYYDDHNARTFLIGINPGRLGAGTTGIPFTDPIRLKNSCGIDNDFDQKPELSSKFIYHIIDVFGGVKRFYNTYYFTSVSPLGFTRSGKNLNYYDLKELQETWEPFMVDCLKKQIAFGANRRAFSLGQGKNIQYLQYLNQKYQLFDEIIPLPHPRWVMQYRLKKLDQFVEEYRSKLAMVASDAG